MYRGHIWNEINYFYEIRALNYTGRLQSERKRRVPESRQRKILLKVKNVICNIFIF